MNLTFKALLQKEWTLLDDKIIRGKKEILLSDIRDVTLVSKSNPGINGMIQITVSNKTLPINLSYPHKLHKDGELALLYLQDNHGSEESRKHKRSASNIKSEIDALPFQLTFDARDEISELTNVLYLDENIKGITSGFTGGDSWLAICTNKRVLILDKKTISGLNVVYIPLSSISSIHQPNNRGALFNEIAITYGGITKTLKNVHGPTVAHFINSVNNEMSLNGQVHAVPTNNVHGHAHIATTHNCSGNVPAAQPINTTSAADELIKFKQLLDIDVITQEEFDSKKKQLLGL